MGSGVGVEGSTEIVGRMTGNIANRAAEQLNIETLQHIWPPPHLQFQHLDEHGKILKYSERGWLCRPPHTKHIDRRGTPSVTHILTTHYETFTNKKMPQLPVIGSWDRVAWGVILVTENMILDSSPSE